jgi:hypothetical protein
MHYHQNNPVIDTSTHIVNSDCYISFDTRDSNLTGRKKGERKWWSKQTGMKRSYFFPSEAFGNVILIGCLNAECTITNSPLFNLTIFIFVL